MAGLLEGKKILVTGVLDRRSIAHSAARLASEQGAEVTLSGFDAQWMDESFAMPQVAAASLTISSKSRSGSVSSTSKECRASSRACWFG